MHEQSEYKSLQEQSEYKSLQEQSEYKSLQEQSEYKSKKTLHFNILKTNLYIMSNTNVVCMASSRFNIDENIYYMFLIINEKDVVSGKW